MPRKEFKKYNEARSKQLLSALKGEAAEAVEKVPKKVVDVAASVVATLETLPDVNHKQRRVAYLLSRDDKLPPESASIVGCSAAYVRVLMTDPRITELVKTFRGGKIFEFADEISAHEILKLASVRAAEVLAEKMTHAVDERTQLRAAIEILKATGEIGSTDGQVTHITIERDAVKIFQRAIEEDKDGGEEQEAAEEIQEADFTVETF